MDNLPPLPRNPSTRYGAAPWGQEREFGELSRAGTRTRAAGGVEPRPPPLRAGTMPSPRAAIRWKFGKLVGFVRSTKMNKSITVDVPWFYQIPKYGVIVEKRMRLMAHDEYELCSQGDLVRASSPS